MSFTWGEIAEQFRSCAFNSTEAIEETYLHVTEGYRLLLRHIDVPEAFQSEAQVTILADTENAGKFLDWFPLDPDVYHLESVLNLTHGNEMSHEPSGMPGRDQFLEALTAGQTRTKPAEGEPSWWVRKGTRIYIRPTPVEAVELMLRYKTQAPTITVADAANTPATPQQYDMPIVLFAAYNYFLLHPSVDRMPEGGSRSGTFLKNAGVYLREPQQPKAEEEKAMFHATRLHGFEVNLRY